jgi:lysophospholipase
MIENSKRFVDSALILHGLIDELIPERISREFFTDIGSVDKTLMIYSGLGHEVLKNHAKTKF